MKCSHDGCQNEGVRDNIGSIIEGVFVLCSDCWKQWSEIYEALRCEYVKHLAEKQSEFLGIKKAESPTEEPEDAAAL